MTLQERIEKEEENNRRLAFEIARQRAEEERLWHSRWSVPGGGAGASPKSTHPVYFLEPFRVSEPVRELERMKKESDQRLAVLRADIQEASCSNEDLREARTQLVEQGKTVALLVMVETDNPAAQPNPSELRPPTLANKPLDVIPDVRILTAGFSHVRRRIQERLPRRRVSSSTNSGERTTLDESTPVYMQDILRILGAAASNYKPASYAGRVALFRCAQRPRSSIQDSQSGWGGVMSGDFQVHEVPGDHMSMMSEPHARIFGRQLTTCLDEAMKRAVNHSPRAA